MNSSADNSLNPRPFQYVHGLVRRICVLPIKLYRLVVSPLFPGTCRFYPTCSTYMESAIMKYGVVRGIGLGVIRLFKCHPWHPGGYDPLP